MKSATVDRTRAMSLPLMQSVEHKNNVNTSDRSAWTNKAKDSDFFFRRIT